MQRHRIQPGAGQESVWDYPRPSRLEASAKHIQVVFNGVIIADSIRTMRILETSHPPVYYIPPTDVRIQQYGVPSLRATFCEFKGHASYYTIAAGTRSAPNAAWYYPNPAQAYTAIAGYIAFYPAAMDACYVDGEQVRPQPGDFYGGWITSDIVGPIKHG